MLQLIRKYRKVENNRNTVKALSILCQLASPLFLLFTNLFLLQQYGLHTN